MSLSKFKLINPVFINFFILVTEQFVISFKFVLSLMDQLVFLKGLCYIAYNQMYYID